MTDENLGTDHRRMMRGRRVLLIGALALAMIGGIITFLVLESRRSLEVTATAYTSRAAETSGDPYLAAWNNRLTPGEKAIAVSRDLLELGLTNGVKVRIEGLPGLYTVRDKMSKRWKRRIDIYMGNNLKRARAWGKQRVRVSW